MERAGMGTACQGLPSTCINRMNAGSSAFTWLCFTRWNTDWYN
jgi:hypothetical protein